MNFYFKTFFDKIFNLFVLKYVFKWRFGMHYYEQMGEKLSEKYGRLYDARCLRRAKTFYIEFLIWMTVSPKLSWSQYCDVLPIKNINERNYYINQVILNNLSVRDLRR